MTKGPVEAAYIPARIRGMHDTVAHFSELRARGTYVTYGFITGTYVSCKIRPLGPCFAVLPAGDLLPDQITPPSPRRPRSGRTVDLEFSARVHCKRFTADFGPKISNFFRGRKILRSKSREIAPKSVPLDDAQPRRDPQRSPTTVQSVGTREAARLHAVHSRFRTEIFEFFSRPQNFAVKVTRDRAEIRSAW